MDRQTERCSTATLLSRNAIEPWQAAAFSLNDKGLNVNRSARLDLITFLGNKLITSYSVRTEQIQERQGFYCQ
jgi:hypothetical protein